ncbi:MAG: hypothetical protein A2X31_02300 [Elusimicrobia bacterium GWB2_63_22]|nr:MAG: hypothetical protein A2X31_02300 [Elusimicrobia bacterium GWB2_63_22]
MIKIFLTAALALLPVSGSAQTAALAQLGDLPQAAVPQASAPETKGTLLLLDPRTGRAEVVLPVGGGFIFAASGKFQPAAFNGSGYVLPGGTYMPIVGGSRAKPDGLTGKWLGQGEWTYQGSGAHCYMNLEFVDTKDYLERKGGYFDCGFVGLASEPAKFAKQGTQLIAEDGQVAGSYENNVVTLNEAYSENVGIVTTIKVDGLHFDYSEIWTEANGKELYVITGRLFTGG